LKKFNLKTGIPFSVMISVIAVLLRLIRVESTDFIVAYYYFIFSLLCWIGNVLLINIKLVNVPVFRKRLFYMLSIVSGCVFCILFDYLSTVLKGSKISVDAIYAIDPQKRLLVVAFRGTLLNILNAFFVSHIKQMKDNENKQIDFEHLKQAHLQANLSSLKEQLSPHFLFNTFNTLSHLTDEQPVKDFVNKMAEVYRYLLTYQKRDLADLKQELDFTNSYLYIIQTRLEEAFEVNISVDLSEKKYLIPPLTLQLLIENALKHNAAIKTKPLFINIFIEDGYLVVVNNIQAKTSVEPSSGIGLKNIAERYRLLLAKEIKIDMNEHFFIVKLPLES
jgi:two-component system LytT family sensor kinase